MKMVFISKVGTTITAKEWFKENDGLYISLPNVTASFKYADKRLCDMLEFHSKDMKTVNLALVGSSYVKAYREGSPAISVCESGEVILRGAGFSCESMQYERRLLELFEVELSKRIDQQKEIIDKANRYFVEV
jgi:hypothetical protein